jgi:hypothetical protein
MYYKSIDNTILCSDVTTKIKIVKNYLTENVDFSKMNFIFDSVFIGYGLKTNRGFYPGFLFLYTL